MREFKEMTYEEMVLNLASERNAFLSNYEKSKELFDFVEYEKNFTLKITEEIAFLLNLKRNQEGFEKFKKYPLRSILECGLRLEYYYQQDNVSKQYLSDLDLIKEMVVLGISEQEILENSFIKLIINELNLSVIDIKNFKTHTPKKIEKFWYPSYFKLISESEILKEQSQVSTFRLIYSDLSRLIHPSIVGVKLSTGNRLQKQKDSLSLFEENILRYLIRILIKFNDVNYNYEL